MWEYTSKKINQEEIIEGIRKNDPEVLKWIYKSQYPKVEQYVVANQGDSDQAKDIFQEAYIAVWKRLKSGDFVAQNATAVTGFLYQIAKNKWLDTLKSSKREKTVPLEKHHEVTEDAYEVTDFKYDLINASFKKLGADCRELLTRFYFDKQSMREIAEAFQWTESTARNNKYRCIQRLREKLTTKNKSST